MSTKTMVEDDWARRIGPAAAMARRTRARLRIWAWGLGSVAALVLGCLVTDVVRKVRDGGHFDELVGLFTVLSIFAVLGVILCGALARQKGFRMEAEALLALRSYAPDLTAFGLGRHLRTLAGFDSWAREHGVGAPRSPAPLAEAWNPGRTRPMLTGASAKTWFTASLVSLLAYCGVAVLGAAPLGIAAFHHAWIVVGIVVGLFALFGLGASAFGTIGLVRLAAEYRQGYVTTVTRTRSGALLDFRTGADLVDPRTGVVIRSAGAPSLDRVTYDARVREIRATHPDASRQGLG